MKELGISHPVIAPPIEIIRPVTFDPLAIEPVWDGGDLIGLVGSDGERAVFVPWSAMALS